MKITTESTLSDITECLTNTGVGATMAQLVCEAYLVVFPWVDSGSSSGDTARILSSDVTGELSAHEAKETVKAHAEVQARLSNGDAFLLPISSLNPSAEHFTLGRSRTCDLFIDSPSVSKLHALFRKRGSTEWILRDTNSTNGTTHNEAQLGQESVVLEFGDLVGIGGIECAFCDPQGVLDLARRYT